MSYWNNIIIIILNRSYISAIGPDLEDDDNFSYNTTNTRYLFIMAGSFYGLGNLINGFLIDKYGDTKMLIIFFQYHYVQH